MNEFNPDKTCRDLSAIAGLTDLCKTKIEKSSDLGISPGARNAIATEAKILSDALYEHHALVKGLLDQIELQNKILRNLSSYNKIYELCQAKTIR